MIERDHDNDLFEVTCDRCPDGYESFDVDDGWDSMITELKNDGWKIRKDDNDEWTHICRACSEAEDEDPFLGFPHE